MHSSGGKRKRVLVRAVLTFAFFVLMFIGLTAVMSRINMPRRARMSLFFNNDGSLFLTWDGVGSASGYTVDVLRSSADSPTPGETIFSADVKTNSVSLPVEILDVPRVTLRVNTYHDLTLFGGRLHRTGARPLSAFFIPREPHAEHLRVTFDDSAQTMTVTWDAPLGEGCSVYLLNEDGKNQLFQAVPPGEEMRAVISFAEGGDLPSPARDAPYAFVVRAMSAADALTVYGKSSDIFYVTIDDLKSRILALSAAQNGENRFVLTWEEAAGEGYRLFHLNPVTGAYDEVASFSLEDERIYDTGTLSAGRHHTFRIESTGGTPIAGKDYAAEPSEVQVETEISVKYATVWAARQMPVYRYETGDETIDTAVQGQAFCVLEETEDQFFKVRTDKGEGYIDATACLINLPDVVGDLCDYDITSSYCCICRIQGYAIPGLTGEIVEGYEHILLSDGTFVVPYLYPVLDDLLSAIDQARAQGYKIKFYDTFRPLVGQMHMFNATQAILNLPIPEETFERITAEEYLANGPKLPTEEELPKDPEVPEENLSEEGDAAEELPAEEIIPEEVRPTYQQMITEGGWHIRWFLANGANQHNYGTAMDITLVHIDTGEEALMQAPVHELSHLAVLDKNTEAANLMMNLMTGIGYNNLRSEWWHFQDDNAHARFQIPAVVNGVSIEGWKCDDFGWRYRNAGGTFLTGTTATIDGRTYTFDEKGYTDY